MRRLFAVPLVLLACGGRTAVDEDVDPKLHSAVLGADGTSAHGGSSAGGAGGEGGSGPSDPIAAWVGLWSCTAELTVSIPGVPPMTVPSPEFELMITSDGKDAITMVGSGASGTPSCKVKLVVSGATATAPPQTCSQQGVTIALTSFVATLQGSTFSGKLLAMTAMVSETESLTCHKL